MPLGWPWPRLLAGWCRAWREWYVSTYFQGYPCLPCASPYLFWPLPWLTMASSLPCSLPASLAHCPASSRPVAGLPCALHRLVLGLRPVASLVSSAIASGWYQYSLYTYCVLVPCPFPCLSDFHQCTGGPPRSSVPVREGDSHPTMSAFSHSHLAHRAPREALLHGSYVY